MSHPRCIRCGAARDDHWGSTLLCSKWDWALDHDGTRYEPEPPPPSPAPTPSPSEATHAKPNEIHGPVGGPPCLDLTAGQFTRNDLLARGLSDAAADELVAFADRLATKRRASTPPPAEAMGGRGDA